ncbi:DUF4339 domain-containing protein, partial [Chitinimonas sp.]|uniref:DUF4339 domain-containing protein n=1 Tax=Chitinimonas sp. TaxID=1934313 RepID=UPI002F952E9C
MSVDNPMADYYLARGRIVRGPFTLAQLRAAAAAGKLQPDDEVWRGQDTQRTRAGNLPQLWPTPPSQAVASPSPAPTPTARPAYMLPPEDKPRPAYMLPPE